MKRLVSVFLTVIIAVIPFINCSFVVDVSASKSDTSSISNIETTLKRGFNNFDSKIEVTEKVKFYSQSEAQAYANAYTEKVIDVFYNLMTDKKYFYVQDPFTGTGYTDSNGVHIVLSVNYITTKDKYNQYKNKFSKKLKQIVSGVDAKWTDVQKSAYLHDQLNLNTTYLKNGSSRYTSTPYSTLVDGKALCAGYARTYSILLNEVGIESKYVSGYATNNSGTDSHAWNLVKIGKQWYHVDCTFDDDNMNIAGISNENNKYNVSHDYFLKSDSSLKNHSNYKPVNVAKSTKYDNINWSSFCPFAYYGKGIIFVDGDCVKLINTQNNKTSKLFSVKDTWEIRWTKKSGKQYQQGGYYFPENLCHISQNGDDLYYNLAHGVYKYDLKTGKATTLFTNKQSDSMIISIHIKKNKLYGTFMDKNLKLTSYLITDLT